MWQYQWPPSQQPKPCPTGSVLAAGWAWHWYCHNHLPPVINSYNMTWFRWFSKNILSLCFGEKKPKHWKDNKHTFGTSRLKCNQYLANGCLTWKEGTKVLRRFQQLRSYSNEIETRNREEIPFSSQIVPRGLSVAEGPRQPSSTLHIYIATRSIRIWRSSRDSNLQTHAWEPGIVTTRPRQIPPLTFGVEH